MYSLFAWLGANIGTIIVGIIVAAIVAAVIIKLVSDKKKGKSSCGGNCAACRMGGKCNHHS